MNAGRFDGGQQPGAQDVKAPGTSMAEGRLLGLYRDRHRGSFATVRCPGASVAGRPSGYGCAGAAFASHAALTFAHISFATVFVLVAPVVLLG